MRRVRERTLGRGGLRAIYRTLDLPGQNPLRDAHNALDEAVMRAFGFRRTDDVLEARLNLNLQIDESLRLGESVDGPGLPPRLANLPELYSGDAIGIS